MSAGNTVHIHSHTHSHSERKKEREREREKRKKKEGKTGGRDGERQKTKWISPKLTCSEYFLIIHNNNLGHFIGAFKPFINLVMTDIVD